MAYSGLTIPNEADAFHPSQAGQDAGQIKAIMAALQGTGVVSGCAVTAQGTPDTTVAVAAGVVLVGSVSATVAAGNVTGFVAAAAGKARFDLVVADSSGTKSRLAGTEVLPGDATHAGPVWPAAFDPSTYCVLAEVYCDAASATVVTTHIVDKRPLLTGTYAPLAVKGCRVYNNANISVANATDTVLTFNSERFDPDGFHSTSSNTSRLTVPAGLGGKYLPFFGGQWPVNGTGYRLCYFMVNGSTLIAVDTQPTSSASIQTWVTFSTVYDLAAGDYVEVFVKQNSGGSLNVEAAASYSPEFGMIRLGT